MTGKYADTNPLQKLHPGEPYFLIRAQDKFSPAAITHYATLLAASGDHQGATECRSIAKAVRSWQQTNPDKVKHPD